MFGQMPIQDVPNSKNELGTNIIIKDNIPIKENFRIPTLHIN